MRRTVIAAVSLFGLAAFIFVADGVARRAHPATSPGSAGQPPAAPALDDATIIAIFDAANTADIETGQLAIERGQAKEVRDFGAVLVQAHTGVRQSGRDLAARLKVTPTPPRDDAGAVAHARAMEMLRSKRGAAFDRAFLRHEIEFHASVIDAVQSTLLPAIENAQLKDLVTRVAPAFVAHQQAAEALEKKLR